MLTKVGIKIRRPYKKHVIELNVFGANYQLLRSEYKIGLPGTYLEGDDSLSCGATTPFVKDYLLVKVVAFRTVTLCV